MIAKTTRQQIFQAAHIAARAAHQQGECYAVTFAAALRVEYQARRVTGDKLVTTITIRRPSGITETVDVSGKFAVGLTPALFARVQSATRQAGRGEALSYSHSRIPAPNYYKSDLDLTSDHQARMANIMRTQG